VADDKIVAARRRFMVHVLIFAGSASGSCGRRMPFSELDKSAASVMEKKPANFPCVGTIERQSNVSSSWDLFAPRLRITSELVHDLPPLPTSLLLFHSLHYTYTSSGLVVE